MEILAALAIVALILGGLKIFLDYGIRKEKGKEIETTETSPMPKEKCKELIKTAIEQGEELRPANEPLAVEDECLDAWRSLPSDMTSFLLQHGRIYLESGGSVGGRIHAASKNTVMKKILHKHSEYSRGIVFGTDEGEIFFALPRQERVFSANTLLDRVDSYAHFFELLVYSAGLEETD